MEPLVTRDDLLVIQKKIQNDPKYYEEYMKKVRNMEELVKLNAHVIAQQLAAVGFSFIVFDDSARDAEGVVYEGVTTMDLTRVGFIK